MNKSTMADWKFLSSRVRPKIPHNEDLPVFDYAIHIYWHREEVYGYNHQRLRELYNLVFF